jgi:DMSO reductase anchor subunit
MSVRNHFIDAVRRRVTHTPPLAADEVALQNVEELLSDVASIGELLPTTGSSTGCMPALPLSPRTRIVIRIVIFVITALIMVALLAVGLQVAAAAVALVNVGVIAAEIADRIMSGAPRTA